MRLPISVRNTVPPLAIAVVWSVFAVLLVMMAVSVEFSRGVQVGFCVAAAVCSLLAVLGLISWASQVSRSVVHGSSTDGQSEFQRVTDALAGGSEQRDDGSPDSDDEPLEIREVCEDDEEE